MSKIISIITIIFIFSCSLLFAENYTVKKGDTLWDISGKYYGNYFLWPILWKYNTDINNPDLIFPKQKLIIPILDDKFEKINKDSSILLKKTEKKENINNQSESLMRVHYSLSKLKLNSFEFIKDKLPNCKILSVEEGKYYASTGNIIRILNNDYDINDHIVLYQQIEKIDKNEYIMKVTGYATIKSIESDNTALALINKSYEPISKGFYCEKSQEYMISLSKQFKDIENKKEGKIVYFTDGVRFASEGLNAIIYDENNTAKVGDIYTIYKTIDEGGYKRKIYSGEAQVIFKSGDYLTARIIKTNLEVGLGDTAVLTKIIVMK
ncbi:LysM peptidoglycan-binding domain-containing protein [Deferribacter thermophilus]|uniref:LysM peptidoglycan-binding domain-containing protein n=1 Tax=Deferribacter thermophilus TaxID=53573 RepID=UPI003C28B017